MRRVFGLRGIVLAGILASGTMFGVVASAQPRPDDSRRGPGGPGGRPAIQPGAPAWREGYRGPVQTPTMDLWRPNVVPYPVYPYAPLVPDPFWHPGYYPYYTYPYPYYGPVYLPPLFVPAETLYGPEVMKRFLGADRLGALPRASALPKDDAEPKAADQKPAPQRGTGRDSLVRAGRLIGFGDNHFANQRYNDAYQRYRTAAEVAPALAEGYFRQAYALIAMGRHELAVKALKRGLDLDPAWAGSDFRNDELYGPNQAAKKAHIDTLAKAATEGPENPDLLFLLGVFLHFDGQPDRAAAFLQRADQLGAGAYVKTFLQQAAPAKK